MRAQMQQTGTQDSTGATPSSANASAYSSAATPAGSSSGAANPGGGSGGASSWKSGKSSFGIAAIKPAGSSAGANDGSWGAGTGSFGMKSQPGGTWRESGGGSNQAPSQGSAARGFVPATLPEPVVPVRAIATPSGRPRSGIAMTQRASAGGHPPAYNARRGASSNFHPSGKSAAGTQRPFGAHRHAGNQNRSAASHGSGAGSSSANAKKHSASGFTSAGPSTMVGAHQPGSAR